MVKQTKSWKWLAAMMTVVGAGGCNFSPTEVQDLIDHAAEATQGIISHTGDVLSQLDNQGFFVPPEFGNAFDLASRQWDPNAEPPAGTLTLNFANPLSESVTYYLVPIPPPEFDEEGNSLPPPPLEAQALTVPAGGRKSVTIPTPMGFYFNQAPRQRSYDGIKGVVAQSGAFGSWYVPDFSTQTFKRRASKPDESAGKPGWQPRPLDQRVAVWEPPGPKYDYTNDLHTFFFTNDARVDFTVTTHPEQGYGDRLFIERASESNTVYEPEIMGMDLAVNLEVDMGGGPEAYPGLPIRLHATVNTDPMEAELSWSVDNPAGHLSALDGDPFGQELVADEPGTYNVTVEVVAFNGAKTATKTLAVEVRDLPPLTFDIDLPPEMGFMPGEQHRVFITSALEMFGGPDVPHVEWSVVDQPDGGNARIDPGGDMREMFFSADEPGTYTVQARVSAGPVTLEGTYEITVDSWGPMSIVVTDDEGPGGRPGPGINEDWGLAANVDLGGRPWPPSLPPEAISWTIVSQPDGADAVLDEDPGSDGTHVRFRGDRPGDYAVQATLHFDGQTVDSEAHQVTVQMPPPLGVDLEVDLGGMPTAYPGLPIRLYARVNAGPADPMTVDVTWSVDNAAGHLGPLDGDPFGQEFVADAAGTYNVTVTLSAFGGVQRTDKTVALQVAELPALTFDIDLPPDIGFMPGERHRVFITSPLEMFAGPTGTQVEWSLVSGPEGANPQVETTGDIREMFFTADLPGTYTVSARAIGMVTLEGSYDITVDSWGPLSIVITDDQGATGRPGPEVNEDWGLSAYVDLGGRPWPPSLPPDAISWAILSQPDGAQPGLYQDPGSDGTWIRFRGDRPGDYEVQATLNYDGQTVASDPHRITVQTPPPLVVTIGGLPFPGDSVGVNQPWELFAQISGGPPGDPNSAQYTWTATGPGTATFAPPGTMNTAFQADTAGTYEIRVDVDFMGSTGSATAQLEVAGPPAPQPLAAAIVGVWNDPWPGDVMNVWTTVIGYDGDYNDLSYTWSCLEDQSILVASGDQALVSVPADAAGKSYTIELHIEAPDGRSTDASASFTVQGGP